MKGRIIHPVRLVPALFLLAIGIGTALLTIPYARAGPGGAPVLTALFTATSAVTITGHVVVDTGSYWTSFGQGVILALIQVGGLGIVSAGVLLGMLAGRDFRLRDRMTTHAERGNLSGAETRSILRLVLAVTLFVEIGVATIIAARLLTRYGESWGDALWNGVFYGVSAFNNAGFSTYPDSLMRFGSDALVLVSVMLAVVIASLGFPVLQELRVRAATAFRSERRRWSLHAKITLIGTAVLLLGGWIAIAVMEWQNPGTLGPMTVGDKLLNSLFHSVMPRTAGFNSVDMAALEVDTLLVNYVLMFVGGGSAGTAGGVKITTFAILLLAVRSEIRGQRDVTFRGRRVSTRIERQALTVVMIATLLILLGTMIILAVTDLPLAPVAFEVISAFSTVGLSTGITAGLPPPALLTLIALMFVGRVGTITAATALALSSSRRPTRYPEENPIVG